MIPLSFSRHSCTALAVTALACSSASAATIDGSTIAGVAVAHVDSLVRVAGLESIEVDATSIPADRDIPASSFELEASASGTVDRAGIHLVSVHAIDPAGSRRTLATVGVKVTRFGLVPTAARPMDRGDVVKDDDVLWIRSEVPSASDLPIPSPAGSRLRRGARSGDIITTAMVETLPAVARGERVEITAERGAIRVTFTGNAVDDGRIGETFRVTDPRNHKTIRARAIGPGRAILEP